LVQPVASSVTSASKLRAFGYESLDVCDEHSFPERVQNPQLSNTVTTLDSFLETGANEATTGASTATTTTTTTTSTSTSTTSNTTVVARKRTKRLMKELHMLKRKPHAMIRIYPSEDDITFWRVLIKGPPSTPYNNGIWLLTIVTSIRTGVCAIRSWIVIGVRRRESKPCWIVCLVCCWHRMLIPHWIQRLRWLGRTIQVVTRERLLRIRRRMHAVGRWILGKKNCCVKRGEGVKITTKFCERYEIHVMCVHTHTCMYVMCVHTRYYSSSFLSSVVFLKLKRPFF
jgi:hypothetical protein